MVMQNKLRTVASLNPVLNGAERGYNVVITTHGTKQMKDRAADERLTTYARQLLKEDLPNHRIRPTHCPTDCGTAPCLRPIITTKRTRQFRYWLVSEHFAFVWVCKLGLFMLRPRHTVCRHCWPTLWVPLTMPCLLYTSTSPRDGLLSRMPSFVICIFVWLASYNWYLLLWRREIRHEIKC